MIRLIEIATAESLDPVEPSDVRRRGRTKTAVGAASLIGIATGALLLLNLFDLQTLVKPVLAVAVPGGIAAICSIAMGGLQWMTGKQWSDHSEWVRLLVLALVVPVTIGVLIVAVAVIARAM